MMKEKLKRRKTTMSNKEKRFYESNIEIRKLEDGSEVIEGYAIVFNSDSRNLGGFIEQIETNALDNTDMSDVVGLFNHDNNLILGRTPKTLKMSVDSKGLRYTITPPDTTAGKDLMKSIKRGDVRGSSFQFSIAKDGDEWIEPAERGQLWERKIKNISKLWDVSPFTTPAYEATHTTIAKRELGMLKDEKEKQENALIQEQKRKQLQFEIEQEQLSKQIEIIKLELNLKED